MFIEQIFELRWPGPPGRICTPITGCFHDKTIISMENLRVDCCSRTLVYRGRYVPKITRYMQNPQSNQLYFLLLF